MDAQNAPKIAVAMHIIKVNISGTDVFLEKDAAIRLLRDLNAAVMDVAETEQVMNGLRQSQQELQNLHRSRPNAPDGPTD